MRRSFRSHPAAADVGVLELGAGTQANTAEEMARGQRLRRMRGGLMITRLSDRWETRWHSSFVSLLGRFSN
jgi:hypothetical protein